jgi:hypothetical protein
MLGSHQEMGLICWKVTSVPRTARIPKMGAVNYSAWRQVIIFKIYGRDIGYDA